MTKKIFILCGGTINYVAPHFALTAPAYGNVGLKIYNQIYSIIESEKAFDKFSVELIPTEMAISMLPSECLMNYHYYLGKAGLKKLETNKDLDKFVDFLIASPDTRCVIMAAAVCDFEPEYIISSDGKTTFTFGKDVKRLSSSNELDIKLKPSQKIIPKIRQHRKDIFVVSFKTTAGVGRDETYKIGLLSLKKNSSNLVFANDIHDKINMVITPEEFPYEGKDRDEAIKLLSDITFKRLNLTFEDKTILKNDERAFPEKLVEEGAIPTNWFEVMKYLFENNAFKPLPGTGKTSGHFGCRVTGKDYERITSERKINHNESFKRGMIPVYSYKGGLLVVGGAKPSVGEKTQELIYQELGDKIHSIVHFHCPINENISYIPFEKREQLPFECGSKECALNTVSGMVECAPGIYAVHLENHGPNIAFHKDVPFNEVIRFIKTYWNLNDKTGGVILEKNTEANHA